MTVIGICGGSGSGKSTLVRYLTELGYSVFESDDVYHNITSYYSDCVRELENTFGKDILNPNNSLNRRSLSKAMYQTGNLDESYQKLNKITHKYVQLEFLHWLNAHDSEDILFLEAPLLYEAGMDKFCDKVIAVVATRETQLKRIVKRDNITMKQAEGRVLHQLTNEELIAKSAYVIHNDGWIEDLKNDMKKIMEEIKESIK